MFRRRGPGLAWSHAPSRCAAASLAGGRRAVAHEERPRRLEDGAGVAAAEREGGGAGAGTDADAAAGGVSAR